ncbi:MAG: YihY/virulence factor BrkB family protein [Oscillospiraceae bacterium]|nr:YihY/virulence factor BrkB family protein [Oscillospiraceae bacterium]
MAKRPEETLALPAFITKKMWRRFIDHKIAYTGGQLAYFFILSIFPFLIFFNAVVASLDIPPNSVISFLDPIFPEQIVSLIASYIEYISSKSSVTLLSFGIVLALFSASKSVRSLIYSFDLAYGIKKPRNFFVNTLFSMLYIFLFAVLLVLCIIIVALGNDFITETLSEIVVPFDFLDLISFLKWILMSAVLFCILSLVYKFIPSVRVKFLDTIPGTLFSLAAFLVLTSLFSFYVNVLMSSISLYGSLSAIILLMFWMYFAGIILVMGAELNKLISDIKRIRSA